MHRLNTTLVMAVMLSTLPAVAWAQSATGRITGTIFDEHNGMRLPGVTVEVAGSKHVAHTDMDGRFLLALPAGSHELSIALEGYGPKKVRVDVTERQTVTVDVTLGLAGYSEMVTVVGDVIAAETSTAEAQLLERKRASTITDNLGAQEMRANADTNAAAALQRVTGLSVVDNQYVFVRGLGERYSNTTLNGATIPSTEPERKVVSLDLFPAGLLDGVTVVKSYSPDRPAEFAGGLIEIVPAKLPNRPHFDLSFSLGANTQTFGKDVLDHAAGDRDWLGLSNGNRTLPASFPDRRLIRGGIYTPEIGFSRAELEAFGESLENAWTPAMKDGKADKPVRVLQGRFTRDVALTSDTYWVIRGTVFFHEPEHLTIEPGTRIVGETATRGTLVIDRGAQIIADGRADAPIVFTSDQPIGERGRADWGGLIINGRAPLNLPGGVGLGEGDTGAYGGDNPDDNSGILRYVRVEFAGIEFSPDNELNGIAFQGVGRGTTVDYVHVKFNKDDCVEMFGGTVDLKHIIVTACGDDSIDWTFGWTGRIQYAVAQQRGDDADRGIEAATRGGPWPRTATATSCASSLHTADDGTS